MATTLSIQIWCRAVGSPLLAAVALVVMGTDKPAAPDQKAPPTVYALLHVPPPHPLWPGHEPDVEDHRRVTAVLFKSSGVVTTALGRSHVAALPSVKEQKTPRDWLEKNLKVEYLEGTSVLRVWLPVGPPEEQAVLVNAVVNAYLEAVVEKIDRVGRAERLEGLEGDFPFLQEKLERERRRGNDPEREKQLAEAVQKMACEIAWHRAQRDVPPRVRLLERAEPPKKK